MENEILTEQEEQLLGQLKTLFYYPTEDFISLADNALASLTPERREEMIRLLFIQLGFEQTARRQYLVTSLFGQISLPANEQEQLVYAIASRTAGASTSNLLTSRPSATAQIPTLTGEMIDQAKHFVTLDQALIKYRGHLLEKTSVGLYYDALKHLTDEDIAQLATSVGQFIESLEQTGDQMLSYNPTIPSGITNLLKKAGLEVATTKLATLGDKLGFLSTVLAVSQTLKANRSQAQPLSDDQARSTLAIWLSTVNHPDTTTLFGS